MQTVWFTPQPYPCGISHYPKARTKATLIMECLTLDFCVRAEDKAVTNTTANTLTTAFGFFLSPQHRFDTWPSSPLSTPLLPPSLAPSFSSSQISTAPHFRLFFSLLCKDRHLGHNSYNPKHNQTPYSAWKIKQSSIDKIYSCLWNNVETTLCSVRVCLPFSSRFQQFIQTKFFLPQIILLLETYKQ